MSDSEAGRFPGDPSEPGEPRIPHRVIGTPPPTEARTMLPGAAGDDGTVLGGPGPGQVTPRELPAGPDDPVRAKKAERLVATCFIIAGLAGCAFIAAYALFPLGNLDGVLRSNLALGGCMSLTFLALAVGAVLWVRHLMPKVELEEARHPLASDPDTRAAFAKTFAEGAETSQFTKRPLLRRTLIAASVPAAVAPIVLLRDLGPLPYKSLDHTVWRRGLRLLTYGSNRPIRAADFSSPGGMITVVPEGYQDNQDALAKAATIIIKFRPGELVFGKPSTPRVGYTVPNWTVENIVAYSKICTHVGCPVALYEHTTHRILCPCHQSTFLATNGAAVIFGPASRPLPQLPIMADSSGFLVAQSDYTEPVGPSFWERGPSV